MPRKIRLKKLPEGLKALTGLVLDAEKYGEFGPEHIVPGTSVKVAIGFCPAESAVKSVYIVSIGDVLRALRDSGHELAALRISKRYAAHNWRGIPPNGISFPIGDPTFEIEEVA